MRAGDEVAGEGGVRVLLQEPLIVGEQGRAQRVERVGLLRPALRPRDRRQPVLLGVALGMTDGDVACSTPALDDAQMLSLIFGTVIMIYAEALLIATFVPHFPARRGALVWLGSTSVGSVVPGPSDVPVIYTPTTRGIILDRRLAPTQAAFDAADKARRKDSCAPLG